MATKWKNTETQAYVSFGGVISWLCGMLLLCLASAAVPLLAAMLVDGDLADGAGQGLLWLQERLGEGLTEYNMGVTLPVWSAFLLLLTAVLLTFCLRRDRKALEAVLARGLGKIWVEVKLLVMGVVVIVTALAVGEIATTWLTALLGAVPVAMLLLYFLCLDVGRNRRFFRHNILHSILTRVERFREYPSFTKKCLTRLYVCMGIVAGVILVTGLLLAALYDWWYWRPAPLLLLLAAGATAAVGTSAWYVITTRRELADWEAMLAQIDEMYGGNLDAANRVPPTSALYGSAMKLNMIRTGIQKAVEDGVRADRTKVELITNVSHDIKTPLTSIISYVELLKKEPLPEQAMNYVNTISQKATRLRSIVQDVFDVSKAATGNISLQPEDLDLSRLLRQTYAEMEESLAVSGLTWRVDTPEEPVIIHADGQRLYRVFQNLFKNCAQYSLEGSRVYVNLAETGGMAVATVRNISRAELSLDGEELTARFVRGDQNRSTEGSGLGLSIAKSFTEACGGSFRVVADRDLFAVSVAFPVVQAPAPPLIPQAPPMTLTQEAQP